jgi:DnaJ-class molecular chaperone with C-terminal Zn finger domain
MHIYDCYRVLGIPRNASADDIKSAYRRLARKYHPDVNQNDPQSAEKFREVQEAYRILKEVGHNPPSLTAYRHKEREHDEVVQSVYQKTKVSVKVKPTTDPAPPSPSQAKARNNTQSSIDPEQKLKLDLLKRVQELIRQKRYVATIPIVEGLRERYPNSPEVAHWQAIAYYRWGSELLMQGKLSEAKVYLSKVLTADPKNRELCFEAKRDLERIP